LTRFNQVNAASAVLNRVTGVDPSSLLGTLSSNGRVFLINPNGVVIGDGCRIDTQGFLASTLNISDRDFLDGKLRFSGTSGAIDNRGIINGGAGDVVLIAPNITNSGAISSHGGNVILAAGRKVELASPGLADIRFEVQAPSDKVVNLGSLNGGAVGIFAGTLSHSGQIQATTLTREGGKVVLKAQTDARLENGSTIIASGVHGGEVQVLGKNVSVLGNASIDTSGARAGGKILVGGDTQGKNPDVTNACTVRFDPNARLKADALQHGNGGKIILWSDDTTTAAGQISARGGSLGGNGGFVEVSGKRALKFSGSADLRAPRGQLGTLLLDPEDIDIDLASAASNYTHSFLSWETLASQLGLADVIVSTNPLLGGNGDITVNSGYGLATGNNLTLLASRDINFLNVTGVTNSGTGALSLVAGWDGTSLPTAARTASGAGSINFADGAWVAYKGSVNLSAPGGIVGPSVFGPYHSVIKADHLSLEAGGTGFNLYTEAKKLSINLLDGSTGGAYIVDGYENANQYFNGPDTLDVAGIHYNGADSVGVYLTHFGDITLSGAITEQTPFSGNLSSRVWLTANTGPWSNLPTPPHSSFSILSGGSINVSQLRVSAGNIALNGPVTANIADFVANDGQISTTQWRSVLLGGSVRDTSFFHLTDGDLQQIAAQSLSVQGGDITVGTATTLPTGLLRLSLNTADESVSVGVGPFPVEKIRINAPLTLSDPNSSLFLRGPGLDINAAINVGTGGVRIGWANGYFLNHQGSTLEHPGIILGLAEGQPKSTTPGIELRNSELQRIHTTGALVINDPSTPSAFYGDEDIRIAGPIDLTHVTSHLHLNGTSITQAPGATITVPDLSIYSVFDVSLGEANLVSRFADQSVYYKIWSDPPTHSTDITFRSVAPGGLTIDSLAFNFGPGFNEYYVLQTGWSPTGISTPGNVTLTTSGPLTQATQLFSPLYYFDQSRATVNASSLSINSGGGVNLAAPNQVSQLTVNGVSGDFNFSAADTPAAGSPVKLSVQSLSGVTGDITLTTARTLSLDGAAEVASGHVLYRGGGELDVGSGGILRGRGTVNLTASSAPLTVAGAIAPGSASQLGTLTVQGDVVFSGSSALNTRLSTSQSDVLAVSGVATLAGTLHATLAPGYAPNGESFNVLTYGSRSGAFSTYSLPTNFQHTYNSGALNLVHTPVVSTGFFWDNDSGDDQWTNILNWNLNTRLPGATDDVTINAGPGTNVVLTSGNQVVQSLGITGKSLWLNGGSLTVNGSFTSDLGVILNGGNLVAGGTTSLRDLFLWNGTFTGIGNVGVSDAFNWSGGNLSGIGDITVTGTTAIFGTDHKQMTGGLLTLGGPTTQTSDVTMTGARLNISGRYDLQSGTLRGGVTTVLGPTGVLAKTGSASAAIYGFLNTQAGSTVSIDGGTLTLGTSSNTFGGTVSVASGATLRLNQTPSFIAETTVTSTGVMTVGGTLEMENNTSLSGAGQLNVLGGAQSGAFHLVDGAEAGTRTISLVVNNAGIIEQTGSPPTTWSGTITSTSGSQFNVLAGSALISGANSTLGGVNVTNSTLSLASDAQINGSLQLGGTMPTALDLGNNGSVNLSGNSSWSDGTISGSGAAAISVGSGALWAVGGADKTLTVPVVINAGTLRLDNRTNLSAGQVSNLGGHINLASSSGAYSTLSATSGTSTDGSFGGGLILNGSWTMAGHTQLAGYSHGTYTYLNGSVIDGAIDSGAGTGADGFLNVTFGENASAVVVANGGVKLSNDNTATVTGTLTTPLISAGRSSIVVTGTMNGSIQANAKNGVGGGVTIAGTHNGALSIEGGSSLTVSGAHNGPFVLDTTRSAVLDGGTMNLSGNSLWMGGTITGSGAPAISVGSGALWAVGGADKTLTVPLVINAGTLRLDNGTNLSAGQVSNLGGAINRASSSVAYSTLSATSGTSTDGSFGGGLILNGSWTMAGHTQLAGYSHGTYTYQNGSVIDGDIDAGTGTSFGGNLNVTFGENAAAVVQANGHIKLGDNNRATITGTLTAPDITAGGSTVVVDGTMNGSILLNASAAGSGGVFISGTHNGALSFAGNSGLNVSGSHNGMLTIAGLHGASFAEGTQNGEVHLGNNSSLSLTDSSVNLSGNSSWSGGTITGSGTSAINVGSGAAWTISGGDKTLTGVALRNAGTLNLGAASLVSDQPFIGRAGSSISINASGANAGQYGHLSAQTVDLDPAGVNFTLGTTGGYTPLPGDRLTVLEATRASASRPVFSSGVIAVTSPVNFSFSPIVSAANLTLVANGFRPINFPLPPGPTYSSAGSANNVVQNQSVIGFQSMSSTVRSVRTTRLKTVTARISLPVAHSDPNSGNTPSGSATASSGGTTLLGTTLANSSVDVSGNSTNPGDASGGPNGSGGSDGTSSIDASSPPGNMHLSTSGNPADANPAGGIAGPVPSDSSSASDPVQRRRHDLPPTSSSSASNPGNASGGPLPSDGTSSSSSGNANSGNSSSSSSGAARDLTGPLGVSPAPNLNGPLPRSSSTSAGANLTGGVANPTNADSSAASDPVQVRRHDLPPTSSGSASNPGNASGGPLPSDGTSRSSSGNANSANSSASGGGAARDLTGGFASPPASNLNGPHSRSSSSSAGANLTGGVANPTNADSSSASDPVQRRRHDLPPTSSSSASNPGNASGGPLPSDGTSSSSSGNANAGNSSASGGQASPDPESGSSSEKPPKPVPQKLRNASSSVSP